MTEPDVDEASRQPAYRIGAAARLTGLSTHTLRKWEDRYGLIAPRRSAGGERLYSAADVKRLVLVKDLAKGGMALSEISTRPVEDLERLVRAARAPEQAPPQAAVDVAVVGAALPTLLEQERTRLRLLRLVASGDTAESAAAAPGPGAPEVVLIECPVVDTATPSTVARAMSVLGAGAAVVVYGFGARAQLDALRRSNVALLRAPADVAEVERLCVGLVLAASQSWYPPAVVPDTGDLPEAMPRRFSDEQLARVAGLASSIACECPRHLVDLILSLASFEAYSAACENRDARDAVLHRYLRITAGSGRALFEEALDRVARHEGLDIG